MPRHYLTTKVPLSDPDGTVYGMCGIATDITDRKNAEKDQADPTSSNRWCGAVGPGYDRRRRAA